MACRSQTSSKSMLKACPTSDAVRRNRPHRSLLVFLLNLRSLHGNGIELALTLLGDLAAAVVILLDQAHLLQLLQDVARNLARGLGENARASAAAERATVDLAEAADARAAADVDLA